MCVLSNHLFTTSNSTPLHLNTRTGNLPLAGTRNVALLFLNWLTIHLKNTRKAGRTAQNSELISFLWNLQTTSKIFSKSTLPKSADCLPALLSAPRGRTRARVLSVTMRHYCVIAMSLKTVGVYGSNCKSQCVWWLPLYNLDLNPTAPGTRTQ